MATGWVGFTTDKGLEYYQIILAYSVLGGLGGALLNAPAYGAIAHFFNTRRGFATGLATTSGGIGGIVFPILLQYLLPKVGFAWSSRIVGFILLGLAVPTNLFIKSRLPPRRNADGTIKMGSVWPDLTLYLDPRFSLCAAGIFLMEIGLFVPLTFIVSYAADHGQNATDSYVILSLLNAGSVLGRFLPGLAADRMGRFNIIMVTILLCTATTIGLWLPAGNSRPILIAYAVLFGFASGSNLGLVPVCLGQLCDARDYARYYTAAMLVASFGSLLGSPLGGALLGLGGETGWLALILFSGLAYTGAFGCFSAARVLAVGWGFKRVF
jgi:MFS family permease